MALMEVAEPVAPPLAVDRDGIWRVGGTRVRLETVVTAFLSGSTAEEILYKYPALRLADVYGVIAYYLDHKADIDAYMTARGEVIEAAHVDLEKLFPSAGILERLLARRTEKE